MIILAYDIVRLEEKLIVKEFRKRNVKLNLVNVTSYPLHFSNGFLRKATVALIRPVSMYRAFYTAVVLETNNVYTINSSETILTCGDKILAYKKLLENKLPIPETVVAFTTDSALQAYNIIGFPVIDKPPIGSWGRLVSLIESSKEGILVAEHRENLPSTQLKVHVVQEYVPTSNMDIRCLVIGDQVLGCIKRIATSGDWRSNVARGGKVEAFKLDEELVELSIKAAKAVNAEIISVDILVHPEKGYLVNEVNGVPEFKGFMKATGINVPEKIVEYIISKVKK